MSASSHPTDDALLAELGGWLAQERLRRNITQTELAHAAGVSRRTVERLEAGESAQLSSVLRVMRALGVLDRFRVPTTTTTEPSPMERLRGKAKVRQRASSQRTTTGPSSAWNWEEESE